jgi:hypothetical protein
MQQRFSNNATSAIFVNGWVGLQQHGEAYATTPAGSEHITAQNMGAPAAAA